MGMMKRNRSLLVAFMLVVSLFLLTVGCGKHPSSQATPTGQSAGIGQPGEKTGPDESAKTPPQSDEPLVVYLNDFDEMIKPLFEEATGYRLELVTGNGAEIMSRIEAEKGNPHWDVVWMDAMPFIHQLGKSGQLLEGWTPKNDDNLTDFAKSFVPENQSYYPTGAHAAAVLVYNTKAYTSETAPQSWADLTKPAFKGSLGMADPAVAAPAYPFVAWFFQDKGMDGGKSYFEALFKNGAKVYPKNPNVAKALTGGEIKVAALQESNAYLLKNQKEPVEIIWPAEGAPASVRVVAIQKQTKHLEAAKAFVEFLLDPKTQQKLIDQGEEAYFEPSAKGATPKKDRAENGKLVAAEADWAAQHEAEIKQWFADQAVK